MAFHDKIGRFAGGALDYLTRDRFDFDGLGRGGKAANMDLLEEDEDKKETKGFLDNFLAGLQSYDPEKNKSESDEYLDALAKRGFASGGGSGSFQDIGGGVTMFTPSNNARNQAIAMANQQAMIKRQQQQEQKKNVGRMAGTAIGSIFGPVGGAVGGIIGGIFCDIRLKEDIAPLCKSEVNDVLSECAFFVKDLNECS
jgi:hypothetical protein